MLTLDATSKIDTAGPPAGEKVAGEGPPGGAASRRNRKRRRSAGGRGADEQVQQAWGAATGTRSRGGAFSSSIWSPGRGSSLAPAALSSDLSLAPWSVAWEGAARPSRSLGRGRGWRGAARDGERGKFLLYTSGKSG